jgi:hypothetical protein
MLDPFANHAGPWVVSDRPCLSGSDIRERESLTNSTLQDILESAQFAFYEPRSPGLYIPILEDLNKDELALHIDTTYPWKWVELLN